LKSSDATRIIVVGETERREGGREGEKEKFY
jgi:hypothetical protein